MGYDIETVGIIGAGLMGTGIAEVSALAGFPTVLVKATSGEVDSVKARVNQSMSRRVERGQLDAGEADKAMTRLLFTTDRDLLGQAGLVIESIVEDLGEKRSLFADLDKRVSPRAIFASNTSTLRITDLAERGSEGGAMRPDRMIGLHFFSPVPAMRLVELAHLESTAPEVLAGAGHFIERLGKTAVPVLDSTGFVVNRLLVPYLLNSMIAFEHGLAAADQIDTAMKLGCGHPMGPLALSDLIGLDIVYAMSKLLYADLRASTYRPPAILRRLVQQGHLGKKTGLGFYDYSARPAEPNRALWQLVQSGGIVAEPAAEPRAASL